MHPSTSIALGTVVSVVVMIGALATTGKDGAVSAEAAPDDEAGRRSDIEVVSVRGAAAISVRP